MAGDPQWTGGHLTGHTSSELLWLAVPLPLEAGKGHWSTRTAVGVGAVSHAQGRD